MKKTVCMILVIALAVVILAGCAQTPEEQIIGKWKDATINPATIYEFKRDGTLVYQSEGLDAKLLGTYELEGKRVIVHFDFGDGRESGGYIGEINGNKLEIGPTVTFEKQW